MFREIFLFEMKQWLKRPGIYIYFLLFLLLSFLIGAMVGGLFSGVNADTNSHINSAFTIAGIFTSFNSDYLLGLVTILICIALMAGCVQKDFQYNCFSFYFTKPISKFQYLMGRFSASLMLTFFVLTALVIGLWMAFLISPNDNGQLGEFRFANFFVPFVTFVVPNTFMIGSIFFSLVTFTRNMTAGYVGSLVFIVVAGIARTITNDIDNKTLSALIDPFGQQALSIDTEYWTPAEQNARMIPFSGYILANRLFWFALSFALIIFTYFRFSFNQFLNPVSLFKRKHKESRSQVSKQIESLGNLPRVTQMFNAKLAWQQFIFLTRFEFRKITRSVFFYIVLALSILLTALTSQFTGMIYGTETYPLTSMQIELNGGIFRFFILILVVFYSGIVIWRERDSKVDELVGASPVSSATLFLSKYVSLILLCMSVYAVGIVTSVVIQTYSDYYNFELGLYITDMIGLKSISIAILIGLAVCFQVFFKNRYVAYFVVVLVILGLPLILKGLKYDNDMVEFNSSGDQLRYSDMYGHGHTLSNFFVFKLYWAGFITILSTFAIMLYQRGKETNFRSRWKTGIKRFTGPYRFAMLGGALLFAGCGSVIYYNTRVLNPYVSEKESEKQSADYEKQYKKYQKYPQPRVVESNLKVDVYPDELGCKIEGFYYLKNKNKESVTKLFINVPVEIAGTYQVDGKLFLEDKKNGFYGYTLNKPLVTGDSMKMNFKLEYFPKNFVMKKLQTQILENGSFFNSDLLPHIGYNPDGELSDNSTRKKYQLQPKPRMAPINDSSSYASTYISYDADWIRFECVLSTKEGQIAIAPGYLQKEWRAEENGKHRHYFHYKMDAPILNFYAFLSAEYEVKKDVWVNPSDKTNLVNVEVYYHKGHEYNVDRMIRGVKRSLDYYTKHFSPYQHRQLRILEFPRYSTFAQSFPNTVPFSEGIGFVALVNEEDPNEVDYPFYVTAHEVAHQWWAHQVIGANVQGSTIMSETMSQYSALMVMEKEYGQAAMSKFLKYEMNSYLQGRAGESRKEVPLLFCENQQYIHYNKGSVVMYALKDYLGEDVLNAALRKYIGKVAYQDAPFTNAMEFYSYVKEATPDSLEETVKDLFERIVVFENKVNSWSYSKTSDGKYKISAEISCNKTRSDSLGKAKQVDPADWIDIGVFLKNGKNSKVPGENCFLKKIRITKSVQKIEVITDKEPYMFGIDPYYKLIDKNTGDNIKDKFGKDIGGGADASGAVVVRAE